MSINSNGRPADASMTDPRGSRDPCPGPMESHAGSQPIARTPAPEQILFIAISASTLARVAMPPLHEDPLDPHYQMLTRPEILVCVDDLMKAFGTLWGLRDFHFVGWPAEVRETLLFIYDHFRLMVERFDSWYETYGRPDLAATYVYMLARPLPRRPADKDERSESVKCFEASRELCRVNGVTFHAHESALKRSYTGDAADLIFSAFENEEVLQEIHATAHALMKVVREECSPAWRGSVAFLDEPSQPAAVHRPELVAAPGDGITATNGRAPTAAAATRADSNGHAPEAPVAAPDNSTSETTPPGPPVVLNGPDEEVSVWGKQVGVLTPTQYRVVEALVNAYAAGERLSIDQLVIRTRDAKGNDCSPLDVLKRLRGNPAWSPVISMAGKACRGYSLNPRPHTPAYKTTHKSLENRSRPHTGG
ncbi:MAG: hypothetical protein ABSH35_00705 [Isosphaeraceae bacterium]